MLRKVFGKFETHEGNLENSSQHVPNASQTNQTKSGNFPEMSGPYLCGPNKSVVEKELFAEVGLLIFEHD